MLKYLQLIKKSIYAKNTDNFALFDCYIQHIKRKEELHYEKVIGTQKIKKRFYLG